MASESLFSSSLIPPKFSTSLPAGYTVRSLAREDYNKGYLDCLRVLTHVGDLTREEFEERYDEMVALKGTYFLAVLEYEGTIVGTGSLVLERKFIHNRGLCGHIEEVSIHTAHQGKKLGLAMLQTLDNIAVSLGCYKTLLDCNDKNEPFYVKCGYRNMGNEMVRYWDQEDGEKDSYHRG